MYPAQRVIVFSRIKEDIDNSKELLRRAQVGMEKAERVKK